MCFKISFKFKIFLCRYLSGQAKLSHFTDRQRLIMSLLPDCFSLELWIWRMKYPLILVTFPGWKGIAYPQYPPRSICYRIVAHRRDLMIDACLNGLQMRSTQRFNWTRSVVTSIGTYLVKCLKHLMGSKICTAWYSPNTFFFCAECGWIKGMV